MSILGRGTLFFMYASARQFFLLVFFSTVVMGSESRIPLLYEYQSPVFEHTVSSTDVLILDDFLVIGKRYQISPKVERDLERFLNRKEAFESKKHRIEIVPDNELTGPLLRDGYTRPPLASPGSSLDLKLRDVFLIDMPGGGVLKAQFRSGLSIQINKNTRFVLRPSRKKLVSIRVDW